MEVKNFYIKNPYPYVGNHNSVFERDYYEYIKKLNPKKILDAGCGTGVFSEAFSRLFPTSVIDAVDFSSEAITLAKKRLTNKKNIKFYTADLSEVLPVKKKYDLIYCHGVLHHIPECHATMKNLRSHLDNNGNMVVWLYNPYGRREIDDIVSIERQLSANLAIEERLGVVKMLKKHLTSPIDERQRDINLEGKEDAIVENQKLKDRYLHPYAIHYTVSDAMELFAEHNLKIISIIDFEKVSLPNDIHCYLDKENLLNSYCYWHISEIIHKPFGIAYHLKPF